MNILLLLGQLYGLSGSRDMQQVCTVIDDRGPQYMSLVEEEGCSSKTWHGQNKPKCITTQKKDAMQTEAERV